MMARPVRSLAALGLGSLTILFGGLLPAQTSTDGVALVPAGEGREIVVLSAQGGTQPAAQTAPSPISTQSRDTATQRIHTVTFEGETYTAATPLSGPWSRVGFDPARRSFVSLLPSIRVELVEGLRVEAVAAELGATGVTVFESLGFAIVELPEELHPADAVARVSDTVDPTVASLRLRGPPLEWR